MSLDLEGYRLFQQLYFSQRLCHESIVHHLNQKGELSTHSRPFDTVSFSNRYYQDSLIVCLKSYRSFEDYLAKVLKQHGIIHKAKTRGLVDEVIACLFSAFEENTEEFDVKKHAKLVSSRIKLLKSKFVNRTYIIPIRLIHEQSPSAFKIGEVFFLNKETFERTMLELGPWFEEEETRYTEINTPSHYKKIQNTYMRFRWFASLEIESSEGKVAAERADEVVSITLKFLQILIRPYWSDHFSIAYGHYDTQSYGRLHFSREGTGTLSSNAAEENVGLTAGWHERLVYSPELKRTLRAFENVQFRMMKHDLSKNLDKRIINAIYWFGCGASEQRPEVAIVHYFTSLESLFIVKKVQNISETIKLRAAPFLVGLYMDDFKLNPYADIACLYGLRSKIVHGSKLPGREVMENELYRVMEITRQSIIAFLDEVGSEGTISGSVSNPKLEKWFDDYGASFLNSPVGDKWMKEVKEKTDSA